jgi:hypothetical protein
MRRSVAPELELRGTVTATSPETVGTVILPPSTASFSVIGAST